MWSTLLTAYLLLAPGTCSVQWCYDGQFSCQDQCKQPSKWFQNFPLCGGEKQSPINIVTSKVLFNSSLTPVVFENYSQLLNITVVNVGYAALFGLPPSVKIRGGGLHDTYKAVQFHLHWGVKGGLGSEHTVDGEQYPMEVHIVHVKEKYATLKDALKDKEGVAALGFFFEVSPEANPRLDKVIEALLRVRNNGSGSVIRDFRLTDMMTPAETLSGYYRYSGSLTMPTCDEVVTWSVFQQTISISQEQLNALMEAAFFETGQPMTNTLRPVQRLNGRAVYRSASDASSRGGVPSLALVLFSALELWIWI